MIVIPAIDIRNGKCVRLTQGNFAKETQYSDDPVGIAKQWKVKVATMLHVVDLDGAKNGEIANLELIATIAKEVAIPIEVGGGIRTLETVKKLLSLGVARVVLGTIALENRDLLAKILEKYASAVAIALDSNDGMLVTRGWQQKTQSRVTTVILELEALGVQRFIYTDVVKDGMLNKPNYQAIANLMKTIHVPLIVGGGISTVEDITLLKPTGVEGVIIGKALYEGTIDLEEAIHVS